MGSLSQHPNIVTILASAFTSDHRPCIIMDLYLRGNYLTKLNTEGPLPLEEVLSLGVQIAGALETAHRLGITHGDIKPQNIYRSEFGYPALGDFGIATLRGKVTDDTLSSLSLHYAAPEVVERGSRAAGPVADQYSLGATLYTMATGQRPFHTSIEESPQATLNRVRSEPIPLLPSHFPQPVVTAIQNVMARHPQQRYPDLATLAATLTHIERQFGYRPTRIPIEAVEGSAPDPVPSILVQAPHSPTPESVTIYRPQDDPPPEPDPTPKPVQQRKWLIPVVAVALLAVAGIGTLSLLQDDRATSSPVTVPEAVTTTVPVALSSSTTLAAATTSSSTISSSTISSSTTSSTTTSSTTTFIYHHNYDGRTSTSGCFLFCGFGREPALVRATFERVYQLLRGQYV